LDADYSLFRGASATIRSRFGIGINPLADLHIRKA